MLAEVVVG
jgi:hypothetical protein